MDKQKAKWLGLLFLATILFFISINTGQVIFAPLAIGLAFIVRKYGYEDLFKEYDAKQKAKKEQHDYIIDTLQEAKRDGKLKK